MEHDGWRSRTLWVSIGSFALPFIVATVFVATGKMPPSAWVELVKWLGSSAAGIYGVANVGQRLAAKGASSG